MGAEKKKFNISRQSLSALCFFAAALAFMLWKCRYGLGGSDEAAVPRRRAFPRRMASFTVEFLPDFALRVALQAYKRLE